MNHNSFTWYSLLPRIFYENTLDHELNNCVNNSKVWKLWVYLPFLSLDPYENSISKLLGSGLLRTSYVSHLTGGWGKKVLLVLRLCQCSLLCPPLGERQCVGLWTTCPQKWSKGEHTMRRWIYGALGCSAMSCWWEIHPLRAPPVLRPTDASSRWDGHILAFMGKSVSGGWGIHRSGLLRLRTLPWRNSRTERTWTKEINDTPFFFFGLIRLM